MGKAFFFILLFAWLGCSGLGGNTAHATELSRLDPHGAFDLKLSEVDLNQHPECKTCHLVNSSPAAKKAHQFGTREEISDRCLSCHNSRPHSGLEEHMGHKLTAEMVSGLEQSSVHPSKAVSKEINCLSCHRAHRSPINATETQASAFFAKSHGTKMMGHSCVECHRW